MKFRERYYVSEKKFLKVELLKRHYDNILTDYFNMKAICRRERERRFLEQSSHQVLSERMKKHVKRIPSEESMQSLRDADERYHVKENETAQRFDQIEKLSRYSYENETYRID